jgi:hypothetical protein
MGISFGCVSQNMETVDPRQVKPGKKCGGGEGTMMGMMKMMMMMMMGKGKNVGAIHESR